MICLSYRTVTTLPVPAMLRAAQAAQDGGHERLQQQVEDDDEDESQCIFHNPELISFPFCSGLSGPGDAYIFLLSENESCRWRQAGGGQYAPLWEEDCPTPLPAGLA